MRDVCLGHPLDVPTTEDQDVVEALSAHGPHEPLREGVRPRCADRRSDDPDALGAEHCIEASAERGVPVVQEEPNTESRSPMARFRPRGDERRPGEHAGQTARGRRHCDPKSEGFNFLDSGLPRL